MRSVFILGAFALTVLCTPVSADTSSAIYGAVVVYASPVDPATPPGASFIASTEDEVLALAVERCKAHTTTEQWSNCATGRWINTGRELLVASVCNTIDAEKLTHRTLWFLKDGVMASDEEIRQAVQRELYSRVVPDKGCFKAAVFDKTKPQDSNLPELEIARSAAKDRAR